MKTCEQCGETMKLESSHRVRAMVRETFRCPGCNWTGKRLITLASGDVVVKVTPQDVRYRVPLVNLDTLDGLNSEAFAGL